jgi:hypothetical protein
MSIENPCASHRCLGSRYGDRERLSREVHGCFCGALLGVEPVVASRISKSILRLGGIETLTLKPFTRT